MKYSLLELIISISYCFLRIHNWLKGLPLLFQNKVMWWLLVFYFPFDFTNEHILSLMLLSDLCDVTWQVHWRVIFCLSLTASVKPQRLSRWFGWLLFEYVCVILYKHCFLISYTGYHTECFQSIVYLFFLPCSIFYQ